MDNKWEQLRRWRFDLLDPEGSNRWKTLQVLDESQLAAAQELRNDLNRTNAPVLIRIVRKTGF